MKLLIIGAPGSGKTTLASRMSAAYSVPMYELEKIAYVTTNEGQRKRTKKEMLVELAKIDVKGPWIMAGVPDKTYDFLYGWADKIFWLDPPKKERNKRILKRFVKHQFLPPKGEVAPSLASLGSQMWKSHRAEGDHAKKKLAKALAPYAKKVVHIKSAQTPTPKPLAKKQPNVGETGTT